MDCDADGLPDLQDEDDLNPDQDDDGVLDGDEKDGCVNLVNCEDEDTDEQSA